MAEILVFGATGFTGRLTARALHDAGASFALAGRNQASLASLAAEVGNPEVRTADAPSVDSLVAALEGCKVLITTVGPFEKLGATAVAAALKAGVHYIDSAGEGVFIGRLISEHHDTARAKGIAMAPAMGFDEVPGDVACAIAAEGMTDPDIVVTYSFGRSASSGTIRSALGLMFEPGPWVKDGSIEMVAAGQRERWAPMPPPLGPRSSRSFPLALARLAPLHLAPRTFQTYATTGRFEGHALRYSVPALRMIMRGPIAALAQKATKLLPEGPGEEARAEAPWTILVEAKAGSTWRNVVATGFDVYGLTARTLTTAAIHMASRSYARTGVLSPVQAFGVDTLRRTLEEQGTTFHVYAPT